MEASGLLLILLGNLLVVRGSYHDDQSRTLDDRSKSRILLGQPALVSQFPYLVSLLNSGVTCAGSIISEHWILSAGHCTAAGPCDGMQVFVTNWLYSDPIYVTRCYVHPRYVMHTRYHPYDVSLVYVATNVLQDGRTSAIPLPRPGEKAQLGTPAVITGWGEVQNGVYPGQLLTAQVRVVDWSVCDTQFRQSQCGSDPQCWPLVQIPRRILCTQGAGSGTCFGDSGGPVVVNGILAGIVSFGVLDGGRCVVGAPSLHVNVVDYLPWIYSIIDPRIDTSQMPVQPEY